MSFTPRLSCPSALLCHGARSTGPCPLGCPRSAPLGAPAQPCEGPFSQAPWSFMGCGLGMETWAPRPPCPWALVLQGPSAAMRGCVCPAHMPAPAPSPSHVGAVLWGLLGGGGSREGDRGWAEPGLHEGGRAHLDRPARPAYLQIDRYAQRDLKKGLHLYGTPGNVGLTNAWSIIQTDVSGGRGRGGGPT